MDKLSLKYELDDILKSNVMLSEYTNDIIKMIDDFLVKDDKNISDLKMLLYEYRSDVTKILEKNQNQSQQQIKKIINLIEYVSESNLKNDEEIKENLSVVKNSMQKNYDKLDKSVNDMKNDLQKTMNIDTNKLTNKVDEVSSLLAKKTNEIASLSTSILENQEKQIADLNQQLKKQRTLKNIWLALAIFFLIGFLTV